MNKKIIMWMFVMVLLSFNVFGETTDNMTSMWEFNTDGSIPDLINLNNITNNGATFLSSGKLNGAYDTDGVSQYMTIPNAACLPSTNAFSLSFWFQWEASGSGNDEVFNSGTSGTGTRFLISINQDGNIYTTVGGSDAIITTSFLENTWYNMAVTGASAGGNIEFFINSVSVGNYTNSRNLVKSNCFIARDASDYGTAAFGNIKIDSFGIWENREITQEEIDQIYNNGDGVEYDFIVYGAVDIDSNFTTNKFSNNLQQENLTFTGNQNITRYLKLPLYTDINSFQLNFTGYNLSGNYTTETYLDIGNDGTKDWEAEYSPFKNKSATFFYPTLQSIIDNSCNCVGCTTSSYTCSIPFTFNSNSTGILEYSELNVGYEYIFNLNNCTTGDKTINFTLRDEDTNNLLYGDIASTFSYSVTNSIDGKVLGNYSFSVTNTTDEEVCLYPSYANITTDLQVLYTYDGSSFNYFQEGLILTNISKEISLYYVNQTTQVLFNVKDNVGDVVENALVEIQKYDVGSNSYKTTEIIKTDLSGNAVGNVVLNTAFYRVYIFYNGELKLTDLTQFVSTTKNYVINIQAPNLFDDFEDVQTISYEPIIFNNASNNFRFVYSDPSLVLSKICLKVELLNVSGNTLINETCLSTQSGTILIGITNKIDTSYLATAYTVLNDNREFLLDAYSIDFNEDWKVYDNKSSMSGIYVTWMIVATMFFLGLVFHPIIALLMMVMGIFVSILAGFWEMSYTNLITLIIMIAIGIWRINQSK